MKQIAFFEMHFTLQYGMITGKYEEDTVVGDLASTIIYWIYFKTNNTILFKQRVGLNAYEKWNQGDQIVVQVSPENPRLCRAELE